jgi:hypothetical protein
MADAAGNGFPTIIPRFPQQFADWMICTPGPSQSAQDMSQNVDALAADGTLSQNNADTLQKDLSKASRDLTLGKTRQASNDLGDFVKDVTKMMRKAELAQRFGQPLIDAASAAISQL